MAAMDEWLVSFKNFTPPPFAEACKCDADERRRIIRMLLTWIESYGVRRAVQMARIRLSCGCKAAPPPVPKCKPGDPGCGPVPPPPQKCKPGDPGCDNPVPPPPGDTCPLPNTKGGPGMLPDASTPGA